MKQIFLIFENIIGGFLPLCLLILIGVYISIKGRFFQFVKFPKSVKLIISAFKNNSEEKDGISSFGAACTALSGTVGTGNIAGVAGAISIGGAGAIFWMWISALIGMAVKFAEISVSVKYREKKRGNYIGGPMFYIKNGMNKKYRIFSFIYALACLPAVICTGNITQTNSAVFSVSNSIFVRLILGLVFSVLTALVAIGGSKRIGAVTEKIVPVMSVIYLLLSLGVITFNIKSLPIAFFNIFKGAVNPESVTGGVIGSVISCIITGATRGVFSNEAGLGSSAIAHAVAYDAKEETQGYFGIIEVFLDTIVICTLTALTILCSGVNIEYGILADAQLVKTAFFSTYGNSSGVLLAVMMLIFAFSSVIGWALYGVVCTEFLFKEKGKKIFLIVYPFFCLVGALCNTAFAWRVSTFFNGVMLCVNLPFLFLLFDEKLIDSRGKKID